MKIRIQNLAAAAWQSMVEFLRRPFRIYQSRDCEGAVVASNDPSRGCEGAVVPLTSEAMRVQMPAELRQAMCEDMRREMQRLLREELRQVLADPVLARSLRNPFVGTLFPFAAGTCPTATVDSGSTNNKLAKFTNVTACTLGNSVVTESSGKIGIGTDTPAVALDVSGTIRAVLGAAAPFGKYLIPTGGAANGFRFGFGNNLYFDGADWRTKGDGANNAGSGILTDIGLGHLQVFALPSTGAADQVVSNSSLATYERMRITAAGNVGIGTATPDSKLDVRGSINQIVYLRPNGSTDGTQINSAISALPSNGGIIYLTPGDYYINTTVNINKSGVKLRGYGGTWPDGQEESVTTLKWYGSSGGTMISMVSPSNTDQIRDPELSDLTLDGHGTNYAGIGLLLDKVISSKFRSVHVRHTSSTGIGFKLTTSGDGVNTSWNLFENCSAIYVSQGLVLDGNGTNANTCHNTFVGFSLLCYTTSADIGIWLKECDNNSFYRTYILCDNGLGVLVEDPRKALSNYFYHLQPGAQGLRVNHADTPESNGNKNLIFGYDQANGQLGPSTNPANLEEDVLFWINSKGQIRGL